MNFKERTINLLSHFIYDQKDYKIVIGIFLLGLSLHSIFKLCQMTFLKPFPNYSKKTIGKIDKIECQRIANKTNNNWLGNFYKQYQNFIHKIDSEPTDPKLDQECRIVYSYVIHDKKYSVSSDLLENEFDKSKRNDRIIVFYNPNDPKDSIVTLTNTIIYQYFYWLVFLLFLLIITCLFFLYNQLFRSSS